MRGRSRWLAILRSYAARVVAVGCALAFVASVCLVRMVSLQLMGGATADAAVQGRTLKVTTTAKRGRILDSSGIVLAQSVERYNIIANPMYRRPCAWPGSRPRCRPSG